MSEVNKKIQEYLQTNHNELFNDDGTEKQSINDLLFNLFSSEIKSDDKKGYIRKQKARYKEEIKKQTLSGADSQKAIKEEKTDVITCNNKTEIENNSNYDNVIMLLQETLQNHSLQITELINRITELESKEVIKQSEVLPANELQSQISQNDLTDTEKARYTFYITTSNIDYLKAFCKENNNISITSVINFMISQFKNNYPVKSPGNKKAKNLF